MKRVLPGHWRLARLDEAADVTLGQSPPGDSYNESGAGMPFFQGKAEFGSLHPEVRKFTTAGTKFAAAGDILLSVRAPVGPTNVTTVDCAIGRGLAGVRARSDVNQKYLLWALRAQAETLASMGAGSTFPAVTGKQVRSLPIPIAPPDEQRRIVDILEDHLSRLNAANDYLDVARARSDAIARSSAIAAIRTAEADASTATSTLGQIARVGSGTTPRRDYLPYWHDGRIPWVTSGELAQGVITATRQSVSERALAETSLKLWPAGTILVAMYGEGKTRGTVGELGIEATTNQACAAINLYESNETTRAWARLVLEARYETMRRSSNGGVQPNLNLGYFKAMSIPWPDQETMARAIASHIELSQESVRLRLAAVAARKREDRLRRALLAAAFSGRLARPSSDVDQTDELTPM
jgi:type I restriction enzyme S subunit